MESELYPTMFHTDTKHLKENIQSYNKSDPSELSKSTIKNDLLYTSCITTLDQIPKVTIKQIIKATSFGFGNTQARKVQELSVNQQLVLVILSLLDKTLMEETKLSKLTELYFNLCKESRYSLPMVTRFEFNDLIGLLQDNV